MNEPFSEGEWKERKENYILIDGHMIDTCDSASRAKVKGGEERVLEELSKLKNKTTDQKVVELNITLGDDEVKSQYLDLGEVNDIWYYGINDAKGREAIITSDKHILRNTEEKFKDKLIGENEIKPLFDYSGYIGDIAPRWRKDSIKEFMLGKIVDKLEVANKIKDQYDFFMDYGEYPYYARTLTCLTLATYCYPLFFWFAHILFNAPSQSGKSKNAYLFMKMAFSGFDLGASAGVTPAQIFRTLEANRGTVLIDEFERRDNSESQQLVNQILNASAGRDAYVIRTEQVDKKWKAWKFPIFCPKIVCNITGVNPTSLSRFIVFHLLKTTTKKGKEKPYRKKHQDTFKKISDECHILIMQHWKEIKDIYENLELDLSNRDEDNFLPICAIAKWLGGEYEKDVNEFIKNYKELEVHTGDLTETLLLKILEHIDDQLTFYTAKEIVGWAAEELSSFKSPVHWVGRIMGQYKFKSIHRSGGNGYLINKGSILNILTRYFPSCTEVSSLSSSSSLNSQTSLNSQKTSKTGELGELSEHSERAGKGMVSSEVPEKYPFGIPGKPFVPAPDVDDALKIEEEEVK